MRGPSSIGNEFWEVTMIDCNNDSFTILTLISCYSSGVCLKNMQFQENERKHALIKVKIRYPSNNANNGKAFQVTLGSGAMSNL